MSTRCIIKFCRGEDKRPWAKVYRHYDGDPETVKRDLGAFFDDVLAQCGQFANDNRFQDPSYLAAKFVVWQAARYADMHGGGYKGAPKGGPLHFSGVAPHCGRNPRDIEYVHTVQCDPSGNREGARPTVRSARPKRRTP